jgi:hypothetical protein
MTKANPEYATAASTAATGRVIAHAVMIDVTMSRRAGAL